MRLRKVITRYLYCNNTHQEFYKNNKNLDCGLVKTFRVNGDIALEGRLSVFGWVGILKFYHDYNMLDEIQTRNNVSRGVVVEFIY